MANRDDTQRLRQLLAKEIEENIAVTVELARSSSAEIVEASALIIMCLRTGGKIIAFGNGGSAAEAQHLVAELVGRYRADRQPLSAIALTSDSASVTAIANDYGFEQVFARQLMALAKPGDIAVAISTSGGSPNVLRALEAAGITGVTRIGLTGNAPSKMRELVDICISAPSDSTPRIQEVHTLIVHMICGIVEAAFLKASASEPISPLSAR